jgi:phosphomethylpyrimidine synthase
MQMKIARNGEYTEEMKYVAKKEGVDIEKLRRNVASGRVVILKNVKHDVEPVGVGTGLRVKVNANIGTSMDIVDVEAEVRKAKIAKKYGADTIMDLSTGGDLNYIRRRIMSEVPIVIGTVPIYQAAWDMLQKKKAIVEMTEDDMFRAVEMHLKDGGFSDDSCGCYERSSGEDEGEKEGCGYSIPWWYLPCCLDSPQ